MDKADHLADHSGTRKLCYCRVGRRQEQITGEHRHICAERGKHGGLAPADHTAVLEVVVNQRRVVKQFSSGADDNGVIPCQPQPLGCFKTEPGPNAMATGSKMSQGGLDRGGRVGRSPLGAGNFGHHEMLKVGEFRIERGSFNQFNKTHG